MEDEQFYSAGDQDHKYLYTWKIKNYSLCGFKEKKGIKSPFFTPNNFDGSMWYLVFEPSRCDGRLINEYIECYLLRCDDDLGPEEIFIAFQIEIIGGSNTVITKTGSNLPWHKFKRGARVSRTALFSDENMALDSLYWKTDTLTIRCRMFKRKNVQKCGDVTEIGSDTCSFRWNVDFFKSIVDTQTRRFSISETMRYEISVTAPRESIDIKIKQIESNNSIVHMRGRICLLNHEGTETLSGQTTHLFDSESQDNVWKFPSFIGINLFHNNPEKYFRNEEFSLLCEFSVGNGIGSRQLTQNCFLSTNITNKLALCSDFKNLLTQKKHSDIKLLTETELFSAHKSILSVRSAVFSTMFDTIENRSGVVDVPDVDSQTFKSLLGFIYTGTTDVTDYKLIMNLALAADKYQVLSLKEHCSNVLVTKLSSKNACELLVLADMIDMKQLKKFAMGRVVETPEWEKYFERNAELKNEILFHLAENRKSEEAFNI